MAERQAPEDTGKSFLVTATETLSSPDTGENVVQRFYEAHPYPRPLNDLSGIRKAWADPSRRRTDHHLFFPDRAYDEELDILVAGCGTSQAAQYAVRFPRARVIGIDFSEESLRHTVALKEREGLTNLMVRQLAVEDARQLDEQFDKIVCTGVLHHLPEPDAGLRALRSVLKPDGAMHLMVYAQYGRTGVYMLQEYARRLGIGVSDTGTSGTGISDQVIEDLVAVLRELPDGHPLAYLLREAPDFRRKAALADALLNPLDRAYTVPELYDFLANNGMRMGRWLRQAPYLPQAGALASTPHAARLAALPVPEQHAAVELFRGTMVRHSVVAYRQNSPLPQPAFSEGDRWLDYVPLRLPQTVLVEERLPPGAAGVLINRSHTYPDLYLPIDAQEKRLFAAVDGSKTIAEIVDSAAAKGSERRRRKRARTFFERLWQYDQVVFDISQG